MTARGRWWTLVATAALASACGRPPVDVDIRSTRADINELAERIGSRPVGSTANARARDYITGRLHQVGFDVRLQDRKVVDERRGLTTHVVNIIAVREGQTPEGIALVSHYDSVPDGPGAADDALGVATCLEAAQRLSKTPLVHSLFVIVTDGEEVGLMGARAAVRDPDVAARVKSVLNFDGTGAAGPSFMYQSGPGWAAALGAWATAAAMPRGASFAEEIYRRLPNDTDFTVFLGARIGGINFAPIGDSYGYHSDRDRPERITDDALREGIANAVSTVGALDREPGAAGDRAPVYFDVLGRFVVLMSQRTAAMLSWVAVTLGCVGWLGLALRLRKTRRLAGLLLTLLWSAATAIASAAAMIGAAWCLRMLSGVRQPWYASPNRWTLAIAIAGFFGAAVVQTTAATVPERARPLRTPHAVWWSAPPMWIAITAALQLFAPSGAYLLAIPLLAAAIGAGLPGSAAAARIASLGVLVVIAAVWGDDLYLLLGFLVTVLGRLPIVPPVWIIPAVVTFAAILYLPSMAAAASGTGGARVWRAAAIGSAIATIGLGVWCARTPAYTADRPQMTNTRYIQDGFAGRSWWEAGGTESHPQFERPKPAPERPGDKRGMVFVDVRPLEVEPVEWLSMIQPLGTVFVDRTIPRPALVAPPAAVQSTTGQAGDTLTLALAITPRDLTAMVVVLPPGIRPSTSTLAGTVRLNRWFAVVTAPSNDGVEVRMTFSGIHANDLAKTAVIAISQHVPSERADPGVTSWLTDPTAAVQARAYFVIPALRSGG